MIDSETTQHFLRNFVFTGCQYCHHIHFFIDRNVLRSMQTTFCLSATAVATVLIMAFALMAASSGMSSYESRLASSEIIPMPKMSMAIRQGPWPTCVGMSGDDCADYINGNTKGIHIEILPEDSIVTEDIRADRVRIFVDEDGIVVAAPKKG